MSSYLVSEATSSFGTFVETQFIWNFRGYQWSSVGSSVWRCGNTLEVDRKQHQRNHQEEEEKKEQLTELTTKLSSEIVTFGNEEQSKVIGAGSICRKRNWETVSSSQVAVDTRSVCGTGKSFVVDPSWIFRSLNRTGLQWEDHTDTPALASSHFVE
ncbi:hypothetical protein B9Z55_007271 [Caenorhabditis nigoni]|uniref:Uncharacterized protein n=1 Tax=Caenorhabditis nigoni TaxID=1611254 RepID=A0A2G5V8T6_9PELO|nr:hypothetical protein B9Z55_007271 [Caenorhabditis nigoni]